VLAQWGRLPQWPKACGRAPQAKHSSGLIPAQFQPQNVPKIVWRPSFAGLAGGAYSASQTSELDLGSGKRKRNRTKRRVERGKEGRGKEGGEARERQGKGRKGREGHPTVISKSQCL